MDLTVPLGMVGLDWYLLLFLVLKAVVTLLFAGKTKQTKKCSCKVYTISSADDFIMSCCDVI